MEEDSLIQSALEEGFAGAAVIDTTEILFDPSFRPYCAENLCGQYGANHSCPPDCGTPEEMKEKILAHKKALVLQSIWSIRDFSCKDEIRQAKGLHNSAGLHLTERFRREGRSGFLVGASGCRLCNPCARTLNRPCRFPRLQYSCMSAYCIFVKDLAEKCGMAYDCGPGRVAFFGMYVYD